MFDLKIINSVLDQMEEERGISREKMVDAIEQALATAYKKEFGKRGQIIRATFDIDTGTVTFNQIKIVVDESMLKPEEAEDEETEETDTPERKAPEDKTAEENEEDQLIRFDPEKHILLENAKLIKKDVEVNEELVFPLDEKDDFGRIAAQTAKQVIIQKIREAEKESALAEFGQKAGDVVLGHVQRFERGNLYIDLGRVTGVMPYDEQIPGERFRPGERIRALLVSVDETPRGIFLKLSRAHPDFLEKLFEIEAPELQSGSVVVKAIAREAGSRSKIAVMATDPHIDPVGSLVGQRGVRVSTVMSELGGEKIDIIEWSEDASEFIEDALSPAQIMSVSVNSDAAAEDEDERGHATVEVAPDQQSLAIGKGGQNVRLAAKLTGWKIDIISVGGEEEEERETVASESPESADAALDAEPDDETTGSSPETDPDSDADEAKTADEGDADEAEATEEPAPENETEEPDVTDKADEETADDETGETSDETKEEETEEEEKEEKST